MTFLCIRPVNIFITHYVRMFDKYDIEEKKKPWHFRVYWTIHGITHLSIFIIWFSYWLQSLYYFYHFFFFFIFIGFRLGVIHKLRLTLRGGAEGVDQVWHCVTRGGGGILNFVKSHFKNIMKAILHVSTKLKRFHWKALNIAHCNLTNIHVMTFNVHLVQ